MQSTRTDTAMEENNENLIKRHEEQYESMRLKFIYYADIFSSCVGATIVIILISIILIKNYDEKFIDLLLTQPASTMGVPISALIALVVVVLLLRTVQGPIEIEILVLKFKGASGPIIMWVLCFSVLVWGIGHVWQSQSLPP